MCAKRSERKRRWDSAFLLGVGAARAGAPECPVAAPRPALAARARLLSWVTRGQAEMASRVSNRPYKRPALIAPLARL